MSINLCKHCYAPLNEPVPENSRYQFLCSECFMNKLVFVKTKHDVPDAQKYKTANNRVYKFLREDVKEYLDKNNISLVEAHQSDTYGFMSDVQRLKVIKNVCKTFDLNESKVLQDHEVDYFITYGLHIYDYDEQFLQHIRLNKYFHTNNTPKKYHKFNVIENDFTESDNFLEL